MNKQIKRMDLLWSKIIKAKAEYICEISLELGKDIGGDFILEAHHINGKKNYQLRYSLLNGICLTDIQHNFHAHGNENHARTRHHPYVGRSLNKRFRDNVKMLRGADVYEKLQVIKNDRTKVDLEEVEAFLKLELKKYEN